MPITAQKTPPVLKTLLVVLSIAILSLAPAKAANQTPSKKIKVVFLVPAQQHNPFWTLVESSMRTAAKQFNIELKLKYIEPHTDMNRYYHLQRSDKIIQSEPDLDYFITAFHEGKTKELLSIIEKHKVKFISLTNETLPDEASLIGSPREQYKHWLAQVVSDGEHSGNILANELINKAKMINTTKLGIAAISGARDHSAERMKLKGLKSSLLSYPNYYLQQHVYSHWDPVNVQQQTRTLINRHKNLNIIWCSNDDVIAHNVINSIKKMNKVKQKILVGGIDWSRKGLEMYKSGDLATTVGGHFLDGGIALALIFDYHHGYDFYQQYDGTIKQKMISIENYLEQAERIIINNEWDKLDFTVYSKAHNKTDKQWDLSYNRVLDTLK